MHTQRSSSYTLTFSWFKYKGLSFTMYWSSSSTFSRHYAMLGIQASVPAVLAGHRPAAWWKRIATLAPKHLGCLVLRTPEVLWEWGTTPEEQNENFSIKWNFAPSEESELPEHGGCPEPNHPSPLLSLPHMPLYLKLSAFCFSYTLRFTLSFSGR